MATRFKDKSNPVCSVSYLIEQEFECQDGWQDAWLSFRHHVSDMHGDSRCWSGTCRADGIEELLVIGRALVNEMGGRFTIVHPKDTFSCFPVGPGRNGLGVESIVPTSLVGEI